jgi:hypothetical protein
MADHGYRAAQSQECWAVTSTDSSYRPFLLFRIALIYRSACRYIGFYTSRVLHQERLKELKDSLRRN